MNRIEMWEGINIDDYFAIDGFTKISKTLYYRHEINNGVHSYSLGNVGFKVNDYEDPTVPLTLTADIIRLSVDDMKAIFDSVFGGVPKPTVH